MENTMGIKNVKIGEVIIAEQFGNMPIAEVVFDNGRVLGYLSPFRGYCFQISNTFDGEGDMASSHVIGLGNIINLTKPIGNGLTTRSNLSWDESIHQLLKGQATIALCNLSNRWIIYQASEFGKHTTSWGQEIWCQDKLDLFIEEVVHYLKNLNK